MIPHISFGVATSLIPPNFANGYKLRIVFQGRTTGDSTWQTIEAECQHGGEIVSKQWDKCSPPLDTVTDSLLYYVTVCSTICTSKLFVKVIGKIKAFRQTITIDKDCVIDHMKQKNLLHAFTEEELNARLPH